jgi:hypothetical protein
MWSIVWQLDLTVFRQAAPPQPVIPRSLRLSPTADRDLIDGGAQAELTWKERGYSGRREEERMRRHGIASID